MENEIQAPYRPKSTDPYRFENGELYVPPLNPPPPFVPDQGFDGDSIYGLSDAPLSKAL